MSRSKSKRKSMRGKVRGRAETRESSSGVPWLKVGDGVELFKPEKGRNKIDILPYEISVDNHPEQEEGELWYQRTVWVHFGIGASEETRVCPLKTIGKKCPICEHRAELMKDPDGDDDVISKLKPKERELFNVYDHKDEEIKLFLFSYHLFGKQLEEEILDSDEDDDFAGHADLQGGHTLKVRFGKEKLGKNTFLKANRIDFVERDDYEESILDEVQDLDKIIIILNYNELKEVFYEVNADEDEDRDKDKEEKTKRKKRKKKKEKVEEEPPKEKTRRERKKKKDPEPDKKEEGSDSTPDCPHDYEFGTDCNDHDECDDCKSWDICQDEKDKQKEDKPKRKRKK